MSVKEYTFTNEWSQFEMQVWSHPQVISHYMLSKDFWSLVNDCDLREGDQSHQQIKEFESSNYALSISHTYQQHQTQKMLFFCMNHRWFVQQETSHRFWSNCSFQWFVTESLSFSWSSFIQCWSQKKYDEDVWWLHSWCYSSSEWHHITSQPDCQQWDW